MTSLNDVALLRSNELSKLIAGAVGIDPVWTLEQIERLKPDAITDINSRKFIEAARAELPTIQKASDYDQATIVVHIASVNGVLSDYCGWVFISKCIYVDVPNAVHELQQLAITLATLDHLQNWVKSRKEQYAWT